MEETPRSSSSSSSFYIFFIYIYTFLGVYWLIPFSSPFFGSFWGGQMKLVMRLEGDFLLPSLFQLFPDSLSLSVCLSVSISFCLSCLSVRYKFTAA